MIGFIITAAVFIFLEVAALVVVKNNGVLQNIWLSRMSHRTMAALWGGSESVKGYFSLKKQNLALAEENSELLRRLAALDVERGEEIARERLVTFSGEDYIFIPASVIKISRNKQHNYFILDKGSEDGVTPQSGIITANGAIGIIDAVDKHYSFGLSFMNSGVSVSARIGLEGAVGPLSWDGRSYKGAVLKDIPLQHKFEPGDTVWTSGYSSIFPPDIPLGVTGDTKIINGAVNEVKVSLFEDLSALRYVTVVSNQSRNEIDNLEQQ